MTKVNFIAEIAQGYEGSYTLAKKLVREAKLSGADIVKFQLVIANELATKDYTHYNFFKKLHIDFCKWKSIVNYSKKLRLKIFFDVFGDESLKLAEKLNVHGIKIHPTDINNFNFLKKVNKSKIKNVIIGVGGAFFSEIKKATFFLKNKNINLMIGFQSYPTPNKENYIFKLIFLKTKIKNNVTLGFADHSIENSLSTVLPAITLGATYIEKHLTIKRTPPLEDSESAITSKEFLKLVNISRLTIEALGTQIAKKKFLLSENELKYKNIVRRSLVAKFFIKKNTKVINSNIFDLKRTSKKNSYKDCNTIVGKIFKCDVNAGQPITKNLLK